jgi:hypothetical protein
MTAGEPQGLLGLGVVVATSLVVIVYVFLRMAGVIHRKDHDHGGRPPPPPMG